MAHRHALLLSLPLVALAFAGCLASDDPEPEPTAAAAEVVEDAGDLLSVTWTGHIFDSRIERWGHVRPTEDLTWSLGQSGFLFEVETLPRLMQVVLDWTGDTDAELMIMLHSHKPDGTNTYVEHVTEMSAENPQCLQVPTEDLTTGTWQVMIHSRNAQDVDYRLTIQLLDGTGRAGRCR